MRSRGLCCSKGTGGVSNRLRRSARQQRAREKLAVFLLVEPRTLDVEELEAGDEARQRERIDRELGDRSIGASVRLIVEDVHGAIAHLEKVDVSGEAAGCAFGHDRDAMFALKLGDWSRSR